MMAKKFWEKLHQTIEASPDLTESGLAVKAGLSNSAIRQMIVNKRDPRMSTAEKICEAMGTTYAIFMSDAETEEQQEIVRLASQLPPHLLHELLGYGRALAASHNRSPSEASEDD